MIATGGGETHMCLNLSYWQFLVVPLPCNESVHRIQPCYRLNMFFFMCLWKMLFHFVCSQNKSILPDYNKPFQGKTKKVVVPICIKLVTLLAMCLRWRMTKIQVFLVTPLCQHFLVAIVMGFSFIEI